MSEKKPIVLVVDDIPDNIDVLSGLLREDYQVKAALNGERALKVVEKSKPDMILLDIMMPGMGGYEVCRRLKANPATAHIPVIFISAKNAEEDETTGLELGAVDYITKPISPAITKRRIQTHLELYNQNRTLEQKVAERTADLEETRLEVIRRLGRAAEYKDNETGRHVIRMSHYSRLIAEAWIGESNEWTDLLFNAAPMHDIGKIGIPDRVLLKPGKLDEEEWEIMQQHTVYGYEILGEQSTKLMKMAKEIALTHHEKWDGSGYPNNLVGEEIPTESRIIAIADVFDALTSERPYKKAWSIEDAVKLIDESAGSHFDPEFIPFFHEALPDILEIKNEYSD